MKRIITISLFAILSFFLGFSITTQSASAEILTGTCGKQAKYSYDSNTQTLIISGKGAITECIDLFYEKDDDDSSERNNPYDNYVLNKVIIKEGITAIKTYAMPFVRCDTKEIRELLLPNTLTTIGGYSFWNISFASMNGEFCLPSGVKKIDPACFYYAADLNKITVSKRNADFSSKDGVLFSKDKKTLVYYPKDKQEQSYKVPSAVKQIAPIAFACNTYLREVVLPKGLTSLGGGAFCGCQNLHSINLSKKMKIKEIKDYKGPAGASDGDGIYYISGDYAESDTTESLEKSSYYLGTFEATSLQSIVIPDSVQYAASDTFKPELAHPKPHASPLKSIYIGKSFIGNINKHAKDYEGKQSLRLWGTPLKSAAISPKNKKYRIKNHAIYSKDGTTLYQVLADPQLPARYTIDTKTHRISTGAFAWINTIETIHIKSNLDSIGFSAFNQMKYGIKYRNNYDTDTMTDDMPDTLTKITIDGNVGKIKANAFYCCSSLKEFHCKGKIQYIGSQAFAGCSVLDCFTCKGRIHTIKDSAFMGCPKLKNFVNNSPWKASSS